MATNKLTISKALALFKQAYKGEYNDIFLVQKDGEGWSIYYSDKFGTARSIFIQ